MSLHCILGTLYSVRFSLFSPIHFISLSTQLSSWEQTSIGFLIISHRYTVDSMTTNSLWNSTTKQCNISWTWFIQFVSIFVFFSSQKNNVDTFYEWMTISFKNEWHNLHNRKIPKMSKGFFFISFIFSISFSISF